jgi:hypothetical protein
MELHKAYRITKRLIEAGDIKQLRDIFEILPGTVVAADLGIHYDRLKSMIDTVEDFRLRELYQLAQFIGVEGKVLLHLADIQWEADRKKKRPR